MFGKRKKRTRRKREKRIRLRFFILSLEVIGFLLIIASIYFLILYIEITSKFEGRIWAHPSKIYSEGLIVYPDQEITISVLTEKLMKMGYSKVSFSPQHQGQYRVLKNSVEVYLRDFDYPFEHREEKKVRIDFSHGKVKRIYDFKLSSYSTIIEIEPEVLYSFHGNVQEERTIIHLNDIPDHLIDAIICAEDFRFFKHHGIDMPGIMRALFVNLKSMRIVQGGSTITQQLIKNLYLTEERTLRRKIKEGIMAFILDANYPKEKILDVYINEIYLGQKESVSICGIAEASRFYFGKNAEDLNLSESAMVAGLIKSPGSFNPYTQYEKSIQRRNHILSLMHSKGMITRNHYDKAVAFKPSLGGGTKSFKQAPYFVDFLKEQLLDLYPNNILEKEGLKIFTTLDPFLHSCAEKSIISELKYLEKKSPTLRKNDEELEACLISIQPQTGNILTMVGGRNYNESQFNRVTQARRQPGSLFKPFVYLTAFSNSQEKRNSDFTAVTLLEDEPYQVEYEHKVWKPQNYDGLFRGIVTARQALEQSINVPTVRLAERLGMKKIIETARRCGISSSLERLPSLALGAQEVTPLEIATAYSSIANMGKKAEPISIREVMDLDGKIIEKRRIEIENVISPQASYLVTDILKGAVERGTARYLRNYGFKGVAAGKTGTTNDFKDSWFIGYTPQLLTLVWVGYDSNSATGLSGSSGAMRIWAHFMKVIGANYSSGDFPVPKGLIYVNLNPQYLKKVGDDYSHIEKELFIEGTQPQEIQKDFKIKVKEWWKKILKRKKR